MDKKRKLTYRKNEMIKLNTKALLLLGGMGLFFLISCERAETVRADKIQMKKVRYYTGCGLKNRPVVPVGEISKEEALLGHYCYVAHYDDSGKIACLKKILKGKISHSIEYEYHDNGQVKQEKNTDNDGQIIIYYYDEKGRVDVERK